MGNNWQVITPYGVPVSGGTVVGGGGNGQPLAGYRDLLDAKRAAATPRTPNAEYPDGYLGNLTSRRGDRLLQSVQSRLTQRNYQRGVHKGEKIDMGDYFWTEEFNPDSGLEAESRGQKWSPGGDVPKINHLGKNQQVDEAAMFEIARHENASPTAPIDLHRQNAFKRLLPSWS